MPPPMPANRAISPTTINMIPRTVVPMSVTLLSNCSRRRTLMRYVSTRCPSKSPGIATGCHLVDAKVGRRVAKQDIAAAVVTGAPGGGELLLSVGVLVGHLLVEFAREMDPA